MYFISSKSSYMDLYVTCIALGRFSKMYVEMNFFPFNIRHFICNYFVRGLTVKVTLLEFNVVVMVIYWLLWWECDKEWLDRLDGARLLSTFSWEELLVVAWV